MEGWFLNAFGDCFFGDWLASIPTFTQIGISSQRLEKGSVQIKVNKQAVA